ncbi:MAG: hypothetical protein Q9208_008370 [Pyrenodesmia sp. 3 TL-2023]
MPTTKEAINPPNLDRSPPKHDPTALIDVHPPPSSLASPSSVLSQVISLCCFPHPRKPHRRPPRRPSSPFLPQSVEPVFSSSSAATSRHRSTYTSFPAPIFHHNGQPRALDSRLHPNAIIPSQRAFRLRRRWRAVDNGDANASARAIRSRGPQPTFQTLTLSCSYRAASREDPTTTQEQAWPAQLQAWKERDRAWKAERGGVGFWREVWRGVGWRFGRWKRRRGGKEVDEGGVGEVRGEEGGDGEGEQADGGDGGVETGNGEAGGGEGGNVPPAAAATAEGVAAAGAGGT